MPGSEVGLFSVAESSWWAAGLYSLMRLDASYPNSTSITDWEAALLVGACGASLLALTAVCGLLRRGSSLQRSLFVALAGIAAWWLRRQVLTCCGAYVLDPELSTEVPVVREKASPQFFLHRFRGLPVVLREPGATDLSLWTPEALAATFAEGTAAVQVGNVEQGNASYDQVHLQEFFANLDKPSAEPRYLAEENNILRIAGERYMSALDALLTRTLVLPSAAFHFTDVWLWAGPPGVVTGLHADWDPTNLLHHLYGKKTVWLVPPQQTVACYPSKKFDLGATLGSVDPFAPDLLKYPRFQEVRPLRVDLEPGDVLQVPPGWMHYATCSTGCVSVSGRSFSLGQTLATLPSVALSVLHRFGLYGMEEGSTSGYISEDGQHMSLAAWDLLRNISWYRPGEEYL